MFESFKAVLEKERDAEKLILEAEEKALKIIKDAQEKAESVYRETYQEILTEVKRKSIDIKEQAKKDAESQAQIFIENAEKIKKKIFASADQKFSEAVNSILNEILS